MSILQRCENTVTLEDPVISTRGSLSGYAFLHQLGDGSVRCLVGDALARIRDYLACRLNSVGE
jgi:hypothetical protein